MSSEDLLRRKLDREKKARQEAEQLLELKATELYNANTQLRELNVSLEQLVKERTQKLEAEEQKTKGSY